MTEDEKNLILDLSLNTITKSEFLRSYPIDVEKDGSHILKLLEEALSLKKGDEIEYGLLMGFYFGFNEQFVPVLNRLLVEDWHFKHEDIARLLQRFKDPSSVDVLFEAALREYEYLDYDENYSLAVKCIWALGDINTHSSQFKLRELTLSANHVIRDAAEKQLERNIT